MCVLSRVRLFATLWTVTFQTLPSMGFSKQKYRSGLPFLLQEIFPTQGLNPGLTHCKKTLLSYSLAPDYIPLIGHISKPSTPLRSQSYKGPALTGLDNVSSIWSASPKNGNGFPGLIICEFLICPSSLLFKPGHT